LLGNFIPNLSDKSTKTSLKWVAVENSVETVEKEAGRMPRLRGNAEITLDQKYRVGVPARFSGMFPEGSELILWDPQGKDQPYLVLLLEEYFDERFDSEYAAVEKAERQDLTRDAWGHVVSVELDAARRFVIPEPYNRKAGFEKGAKLFLLMNKTYMEIWPLALWRVWEDKRRGAVSQFEYTPEPVRPPQEISNDIPA